MSVVKGATRVARRVAEPAIGTSHVHITTTKSTISIYTGPVMLLVHLEQIYIFLQTDPMDS